MPQIEWGKLFVFTVHPFELFLRGTLVYLIIFTLMRVLRREPGTVGIADLLMVVLIADAAQNAMSSDYRSVLDGFVVIGTIVFWNYALDWLTLRSRRIEKFTFPEPMPLVRNGHMIHANMKKQFVTRAQLFSVLRQHGMDSLSKVKVAHFEGNGHISVVQKNGKNDDSEESDTQKVA